MTKRNVAWMLSAVRLVDMGTTLALPEAGIHLLP